MALLTKPISWRGNRVSSYIHTSDNVGVAVERLPSNSPTRGPELLIKMQEGF